LGYIKAGLTWRVSIALLLASTPALAEGITGPPSVQIAPNFRDHDHDHDRFETRPIEHGRARIAFVLSFDDGSDGQLRGVPDWVAYRLAERPPDMGVAPNRPGEWSTDSDLNGQRIAPTDASYRGSGYSRGHMAMKSHAFRLGDEADRQTHTVLNACPQLQSVNAGVWLAIERLTGKWADAYGAVWIVCGPIFFDDLTIDWIGDAGEVPVAIPHAFFKIVIKERAGPDIVDVLAFLVPMYGGATHSSQSVDVSPYLTSVDVVEELTGLDFLTVLDDSLEATLERSMPVGLWQIQGNPEASPSELSRLRSAAVNDGRGDPLAINATANLRPGIEATAVDREIAVALMSAGWKYQMPRPKSSQARWGNGDGRTTWFNGTWRNTKSGAYSAAQPRADDAFQGDGVNRTGWRRGGSPRSPTTVEWLCSTSGGPAR
jgi:endonuclease G, mitochondrial